MMKRTSIVFLLFLSITVVGVFYGKEIANAYPSLRVWYIENVAILLAGLPFALLLPKAGLPAFCAKPFFSKNHLLIPVATGIVFGLLDVLVIEWILPHPIHTTLPPYTQPFPYSLFLYFSGAFEIEIFYRLIPLTLLMLIFSRIKKGAFMPYAFWIGAALTSLREPLEQWPQGQAWYVAYALISGFAMNFIQAMLFLKQGFTAAFSLRLGHYLIWHIINGVVIEFILLR